MSRGAETFGPTSRASLNDGFAIPRLGLGTYRLPPGAPTRRAVSSALEVGYRLFDTARLYGNEVDVGAAVRDSGIPREELFVTTKLWNDDQGFDSAVRAFEASLQALRLDYVDLYLIHWPVPKLRRDSWRALESIRASGKCRSIGVSNFTVAHLEELREKSEVVPAVNQVEFTPFLFQKELLGYCERHGIQLEAYSPLTKGRRLGEPTLQEISHLYRKTPAQVLLRWGLQHGIVEIPKSSRPERIRENFRVFDFALSSSEMERLDRLDESFRTSWDPSDLE